MLFKHFLVKFEYILLKLFEINRLAIKVVDSKDRITLFGNKLNGNISMQILLLKELGYTVVTVCQI